MTKVAIIAYPVLADDDRLWVEQIRSAYDPQSTLVAAHFTLVFPEEVDASTVREHAASVLSHARPIQFVLQEARAVRDFAGPGGHVFLIPGQGAQEIALLHDLLYGGALKPYLRAHIPFIPHVTVAARNEFSDCERIAELLNGVRRAVAGQLIGAEVVELQRDALRVISFLQLGADDGDHPTK